MLKNQYYYLQRYSFIEANRPDCKELNPNNSKIIVS